jgi:perosamine synthetase
VTGDAPLTRDDLTKHLETGAIGFGLYYPRLMHDYDCYRGHAQVGVDETPRAAQVTSEVLSLPVHQHLTEEELDRIITTVRGAFGG